MRLRPIHKAKRYLGCQKTLIRWTAFYVVISGTTTMDVGSAINIVESITTESQGRAIATSDETIAFADAMGTTGTIGSTVLILVRR